MHRYGRFKMSNFSPGLFLNACNPFKNLFILNLNLFMTIHFLISIPARLRTPNIDGKVSGRLETSNASATPQRIMGTVSQITIACRKAPNIKMVIKNMRAKAGGIR